MQFVEKQHKLTLKALILSKGHLMYYKWLNDRKGFHFLEEEFSNCRKSYSSAIVILYIHKNLTLHYMYSCMIEF